MKDFLNRKEILKLFQCQQSGNCCRCPGYVYVNQKDIKNMATIKKLSIHEFKEKFVQVKKGWSYIAAPNFQTTCFLDKKLKKCTVYKARPAACKSFPDWDMVWKNQESLSETARYCPGLAKAIKDYQKLKLKSV